MIHKTRWRVAFRSLLVQLLCFSFVLVPGVLAQDERSSEATDQALVFSSAEHEALAKTGLLTDSLESLVPRDFRIAYYTSTPSQLRYAWGTIDSARYLGASNVIELGISLVPIAGEEIVILQFISGSWFAFLSTYEWRAESERVMISYIELLPETCICECRPLPCREKTPGSS